MTDKINQVLIVDDDSAFQLAVKHSLKGKFQFRTAYNGDEALAILRKERIDIVLLDLQMRSENEGFTYIPKFREVDADLAIVMSSSRTDFKTVREAMQLGAIDYIPKNFDPLELEHTLHQVLEKKKLIRRSGQQTFEAQTYQKRHVMVGESPAMSALRKTIERVRRSPANVMIHGETGTGKEVVARQLRKVLADGSLEPFVSIDSATIQKSIAESMLFGHEKGAFTGAEKMTRGIFEEANGGVVYFDEIANMPLDIQAKLLRVLQEKEVTRVGSSKTIPLEFRVICATNRNLEDMVRKGEFKDDLYQRLNVLPIELTPLRSHPEDIPLLVKHFVTENLRGDDRALRFTDEAMALLQAYSWPGNVRELSNLIAYLAAMVDGNEVGASDLSPKIRESARAGQASLKTLVAAVPEEGTFYDQVGAFERQLLAREYEKNPGNISKLATALGMDRSHLYTKLKEFGLHAGRAPAK